VADEITTTTANDLTYAASILENDIIDALYDNNNAINLCRRTSLANFPSKAKDFPIRPALTASSLTEGTDASYTAYSTTKATITAGEVGIVLTPTDVLSVSDIVDNSFYAQDGGFAVASKLTTDIAALSSGFTTEVGSTTVNLTEANILDGIVTLEAANVPGGYTGLLHPQQKRDLIADIGTTLTPAGNTGMSARAETNDFGAKPDGFLGDLYGGTWFLTSAVPTATAGADREGMLVGSDRALGYVSKWDVRVELERDASLRATEIVITAMYGVGEIDDTSGVAILSDA
jgi:hypothetical protein